MNQKESIYFISLHKCATRIFSNYVLEKAKGYIHIDYEKQIFQNRIPEKVVFEKFGHIYGTIRINFAPLIYDNLIKFILEDGFISDKKAVFLIRDPRDILVSQYYSFGHSHALSKNKEIRNTQLSTRKKVENLTIDEYILLRIKELKRRISTLYRLMTDCHHKILLKYEDLVLNFESFYNRLSQFIRLEPDVKDELYKQTRPRAVEQIHEHKRSGKVGDYKLKVKPETIERMNVSLEKSLRDFGYSL